MRKACWLKNILDSETRCSFTALVVSLYYTCFKDLLLYSISRCSAFLQTVYHIATVSHREERKKRKRSFDQFPSLSLPLSFAHLTRILLFFLLITVFFPLFFFLSIVSMFRVRFFFTYTSLYFIIVVLLILWMYI